jgi:hypothetical protein
MFRKNDWLINVLEYHINGIGAGLNNTFFFAFLDSGE